MVIIDFRIQRNKFIWIGLWGLFFLNSDVNFNNLKEFSDDEEEEHSIMKIKYDIYFE